MAICSFAAVNPGMPDGMMLHGHRHFYKGGQSGSEFAVPDARFHGADITRRDFLLICRLAVTRFDCIKLQRICHFGGNAVRFNISDGLRINIGVFVRFFIAAFIPAGFGA